MQSITHVIMRLSIVTPLLFCTAASAEEISTDIVQSASIFTQNALHVLPTHELSEYRAGSAVTNHITPAGLVEGNTANHVVSGMNAITDGAFSNASGLPTVIQNSGANVLIQNSTIVNVQLQ